MQLPRIYLVIAPFAILLSIICLLFALANRRSRQFSSLLAFMAGNGAVVFCNVLELKAATVQDLLLYSHITYTIVTLLPVAWFLFCHEYTLGKPGSYTRKSCLLLLVIPAFTTIFAWTNDFHHLLWINSHIESDGALLLNRVTRYGFWFWVHVAYSYSLYLAGTVLICRDFFGMEHGRKSQCILNIIAVSLPVACNLLYIFRLIPGIPRDFSSLVFSVSGLLFMISISRYRLFETCPIEYRALIVGLSQAVVITDEEGCIRDMSETARALFGFRNHEYKNISELIPITAALCAKKILSSDNQIAVALADNTILNAGIQPISLNSAGRSGYSIVLQAVQNSDLLGTMSKREQAVYDILTQGYSTKQIADKLCISENTAKTHIRHIYEKLHIRNRKELQRQTTQKAIGKT